MAFRTPYPSSARSRPTGRGRRNGRSNFRSGERRAPSMQSSSIASSHFGPAIAHGHARNNVSGSHRRNHQRESSERTALPSRDPSQLTNSLIDDETNDDTLDKIIMAVAYSNKNSIGCAYYVAREEKLYFMEDIEDGDLDLVDTLKLYVNPTTIIVSVHADDDLVNLLESGTERTDAEDSTSAVDNMLERCYTLEVFPPSSFKYESALQKLLSLRIRSSDPDTTTLSVTADSFLYGFDEVNDDRQAQLLHLSSLISLESQLTIGCAGAVLSYIQKQRASRFLPNDEAAYSFFPVTSLEMFSTKDTMFVNRDALLSLQIFQPESHPHFHNQGPTRNSSGSKEGLSVYGLFQNLARTSQGKHKLRQCFLRPSLSLDVIQERLDSIEVFTQPENAVQFDNLMKSLKHVGDMRNSIVNLKKGISGGLKTPRNLGRRIWSGLREFAYQATCIDQTLDEIHGSRKLVIYEKVKSKFRVNQLAFIGQMIHNMIDFDDPTDPSRLVKSGVDEDLDERRRLYDGVDSLLSEVARDISMDVPEGLPANLNVVYFPQIGFLISMSKDPETGRSLWEGSENDVWEVIFSSENSVYYKNGKMRQMDDHIGDIWNDICDKEIEILHHLSTKVLEFEKAFKEASDVCGELDCLLALSNGAKKYGLNRPDVNQENVIYIEQGRHVLQELVVPSFVPNDTYLEGGDTDASSPSTEATEERQSHTSETSRLWPNILILTGPNFSGKSVYLKQVALIVYLAHIGSFVPAKRAEIGLTDKILTRVTTRESVSATASAFAIDLQQICLALKLCTCRSLLVIDEFGKGTDSADGAGLFAGVIEHLLGSNEDRINGLCRTPKVLAATHFHELFEMGILTPRPGLALGHMEIRIDGSPNADVPSESSTSNAEDQVVYLYNYREGKSIKSYGTCCAALNGIPREVVHRAEYLIELAARGEDLATTCAVLSVQEAEELEVAARFHFCTAEQEKMARLFLESDLTGNPREMLECIIEGGSC